MKISARNQLPGTVKSVTEGAVMAEVVVTIDGGHEIVSAITAESARRLGLAPGKRVVAVIKSTEVISPSMTDPITFRPIGIIRTPFTQTDGMPIQAAAAVGVAGRIELDPDLVEGLADLDGFSHLT